MFRSQVKFLSENCSLLKLSDAGLALREGNLPRSSVCITFDDGYADNFEVAAEELDRFGVPATFFIATGYMNGGVMWNDRIIEAFRRFEPGRIDLGELGVFDLTGNSDRASLAMQAVKKIRYRDFDTREDIARQVAERGGFDIPSDLMMTEAMVKSLHNAGMEIGAHTVKHPILSQLDPHNAALEIQQSKMSLEELIGSRVLSFAYPNGKYGKDFSDREVDLVHAAGFKYAVATNWGAATVDSSPLVLPRTGISGNKPINLALQVSKLFRTLPDRGVLPNPASTNLQA
jgi:peptidoglycan/xylan/chitin deacetylase (PgdA/CDA1 family)